VGTRESVDCGVREVRDSERQAGHDLSLIGPKTDVRMPHEQVGGCKPLSQGEFRVFNCTGPAISATFGLIGWVTEATRSTPGVWPS